jgi:hypothetical protein
MGKSIWIQLILLMTVSTAGISQYHYLDIVSNLQLSSEMKQFKEQKIRDIQVHSFESNGDPSKGFFCKKKISKDYRKIETYTKSAISEKSILISRFNTEGQLIASNDSSAISSSSNFYQYDSKGHLTKVINTSASMDDDFTSKMNEEHLYFYDAKGRCLKMLRIKNQSDTATVLFTSDEKGNIIDENDLGKNGKHYYYYYDSKNRLTDVVKYNSLRDKLLPDLLFEYNSASQVTQMITTEEGISNNYYVWKKIYNEGLRIIEKCFSKENELLGYFEFEYN